MPLIPTIERNVRCAGDDEARAAALARTATAALRAEVDLTPKPGLVDTRDSGAHRDMTHALMRVSVDALEPGFHDAALAASREPDLHTLRAELGVLGRESEARMLLATAGVNTHRGAIWSLGLLVSAAASAGSDWTAEALLGWVARMAAIDDHGISPACMSNGRRAVHRFGVAGARAEAARGFVQIREPGLRALRASRAAGASERVARLNSLLAIMAVLDDTCVLSRAGPDALRALQRHAAAILDRGGVGTFAGARALARLDTALLAANASPGGAADLLAATLFIDTLERAANRIPHAHHEERRHAAAVA